MINISKLYCGLAGRVDELRYGPSESTCPVVVFNCTAKCNLACLHCYSSSGSKQPGGELNTTEAKKLLHQLGEINCPVVLFSGGEPLLRQDIFELLAEAKRLGLVTVLSSNGTLIKADVAGAIADAGVSYVGISIDGPEGWHDEFRNSRGSFKAAVAGIKNCRSAGLRTGLRFTITKANARYVPFIFELAEQLNVRRLCFYHLVSAGRAASLAEKSLTPQQSRQAVDCVIDKTLEAVNKAAVDEVLTVDNHADGPYLLLKMQKEGRANLDAAKRLLLAAGGNKVGERIAAVSWDGSVFADQFWRNWPLGNIKDRTFKDIWYNGDEPVLARLRNKEKFADRKCRKCRWFDYCKGNFRFLGPDPADVNWLLEPACYLTEQEINP